MDAADVGHSRRPTDRGHRAAIEVVEWLGGLPLHRAPDVPGGVLTLLDCHRRHARQRLSACLLQYREVAEHVYLRMASDGEVVLHRHAPAAVRLQPELSPERRGGNAS